MSALLAMANGNKDDVLFARGAAQSDDSDMWDDTALIKAYDKAVASFKTALKGENDPPALKKDPPGKKRKNNKNNVGRKRSNAPPDKEVGLKLFVKPAHFKTVTITCLVNSLLRTF